MSDMHRHYPDESDEQINARMQNALSLARGVLECEMGHTYSVVPKADAASKTEATQSMIGVACPSCGCPLAVAE